MSHCSPNESQAEWDLCEMAARAAPASDSGITVHSGDSTSPVTFHEAVKSVEAAAVGHQQATHRVYALAQKFAHPPLPATGPSRATLPLAAPVWAATAAALASPSTAAYAPHASATTATLPTAPGQGQPSRPATLGMPSNSNLAEAACHDASQPSSTQLSAPVHTSQVPGHASQVSGLAQVPCAAFQVSCTSPCSTPAAAANPNDFQPPSAARAVPSQPLCGQTPAERVEDKSEEWDLLQMTLEELVSRSATHPSSDSLSSPVCREPRPQSPPPCAARPTELYAPAAAAYMYQPGQRSDHAQNEPLEQAGCKEPAGQSPTQEELQAEPDSSKEHGRSPHGHALGHLEQRSCEVPACPETPHLSHPQLSRSAAADDLQLPSSAASGAASDDGGDMLVSMLALLMQGHDHPDSPFADDSAPPQIHDCESDVVEELVTDGAREHGFRSFPSHPTASMVPLQHHAAADLLHLYGVGPIRWHVQKTDDGPGRDPEAVQMLARLESLTELQSF